MIKIFGRKFYTEKEMEAQRQVIASVHGAVAAVQQREYVAYRAINTARSIMTEIRDFDPTLYETDEERHNAANAINVRVERWLDLNRMGVNAVINELGMEG